MTTSVIVVSYNSLSVIEQCLESLGKQSLSHTFEVIVVDNASADGTPDLIRARYPWVKLIAGSENVGFSRGVNIGIRAAAGKYFLILNPDTVLPETAIEKLVEFMEKKSDAGILGPKLVFPSGEIQYSCRRFYTWKVLLLRRTFLGKIFRHSSAVSDHLMLDFDHDTTREVDWVLGACMLVRRQAVESVGLMDERFFMYFEDVDWCYRMKQKGWKVYYRPEVVVVHSYARGSAQSVINRSFAVHLASLIRYYEKWNLLLYHLKKRREVAKITLFLVLDIVAFNLAFLSAYYLRAALHDVFTNPIYPISAYGKFVFFENLLFVFTYFALGLYRIRRETGHIDELFHVGRAIVLASILLMASTYLSHVRTYSRMVVAFLVPCAILYDWLLRTLVRRIHRRLLAQKIDLKRILLVGPWGEARDFEARLLSTASLGVDVVGVIPTDEPAGGTAAAGLGELDDLEQLVQRYRIQEVIILPGSVPEPRLADIVTLGRRRMIDVTVLTDYSGLVTHQATVADLAGRPVIAYRRDTRYALDRTIKRLFDIVVGGVFVVVCLPFYVLYSLYSYAKGGKPFSREERLGLGGKPFTLPLPGNGSQDGPTDIVNLPLFWLVVTGKMSMVGPYPVPSDEAGLLGRSARFRFEVRPGVTGYWRLGRKDAVTVEDILAQDANYTRNWSFVQDLKILIMTLDNLILGRKRRLDLSRQANN